ncbi:unnamed protein product [Haemonchus placei]|uniref:Uncharacterized protein n=1 Tax=Haemonchus placei TaxID=6290 RepID=A0A0N4W4V4_HAEPC|nr:unnamed protein product [Haemonchus placei]
MSPDFLKELSEYLYGLIIGKYEVRQQQHNQGNSPSNNEVVLDYEDETRAIDARIGDLNLLTANESPQAAQREQQTPFSRTLPKIAQQRPVSVSHPRTRILFMAQPVPTQSEAVQIPAKETVTDCRRDADVSADKFWGCVLVISKPLGYATKAGTGYAACGTEKNNMDAARSAHTSLYGHDYITECLDGAAQRNACITQRHYNQPKTKCSARDQSAEIEPNAKNLPKNSRRK